MLYFYPRLKDVRDDADKKQDTIARHLGITKQQYSLYETGKREIPLHHLISLAEYYNISLDYLCGLIPHPRPLNQDTRESYKIIINKKI